MITQSLPGAMVLSLSLVGVAAADVEDRPFDFSDAFYLQNGVNPTAIIGRPDGTPPGSIIDNNVSGPEFRNVRLLQHAATWDHSGHITFFHVVGLLFPDTFTDNPAGDEAREIADTYKIYEFPRASNPPNAVFPKNQDAVADLTNGYFSNDPLGSWQINLVRYTPAAFNTPEGQEALADLAAENGLTLDGTPVIKTLSDIQNLADGGFITIQVPPADGVALRWFMCPIPEDLTDGTIAPDAHVEVIRQPDGLPLRASHEHLREFHCLQATGDFCNSDCLSDVDANRDVNIDDLFHVIAAWGPCANCVQDINNDGQVNIDDLFAIIGTFGACP
jgi:hypothetical protein